ncbi:MAG: hypothetical protein J2P22_00100 [Nocardioides sp.]|nr:hypothetical protein [Nocardioides sp.]
MAVLTSPSGDTVVTVSSAWTVASDRVARLVMPTAYRLGRAHQVGRPRVVPEKYGHAVVPGGNETLCGRAVGQLHRFDTMLFEALGHHLRCPDCDALAGRPHAAPVVGRRAAPPGA